MRKRAMGTSTSAPKVEDFQKMMFRKFGGRT